MPPKRAAAKRAKEEPAQKPPKKRSAKEASDDDGDESKPPQAPKKKPSAKKAKKRVEESDDEAPAKKPTSKKAKAAKDDGDGGRKKPAAKKASAKRSKVKASDDDPPAEESPVAEEEQGTAVQKETRTRQRSQQNAKTASATSLQHSIRMILDNAQRSQATHRRYSSQLNALAKQLGDPNAFVDLLWRALRIALPSTASQACERVFKLLSTFLHAQQDNTLALGLLEKVLPYAGADDKTVRRNACDMVTSCMASLQQRDEDTEQQAALLDEVAAVMHARQDDKVSTVRCHAVDAMYLLQQPSEGAGCDVTHHYLQMLCEDSHPQVRAAVMNRLEVSKHVVPLLLVSISDHSYAVRRAAFKHLSRVPPKWLTIQQRVDLLRKGLADRNKGIRTVAHTIVTNWLRRVNSDAVALQRLFDVEGHEELSVKVAGVVYELKYARPKLEGDGDIAAWDREEGTTLRESLTAEGILQLRVIAERLLGDMPDRSDAYLPDMDFISNRLRSCVAAVVAVADGTESDIDHGLENPAQASSMAEQLLKMCLLYEVDAHTEEQRQNMLSVVFTFASLTQVENPCRFVQPAMALFRHFYRDREDDLLRLVTLILGRLRGFMSTSRAMSTDEGGGDDLLFDAEAHSRYDQAKQADIAEKRKQCRQLELKILRMRKQGASVAAVQKEDELLGELESELASLVMDSATDVALWRRSLEIILNMLQHSSRGGQLAVEHAEVALAAAKHHWNPHIRAKALQVVAVYSVASADVVPTYAPVFLQSLRKSSYKDSEHATEVMEAALRGLTDIFLEHGPAAVKALQGSTEGSQEASPSEQPPPDPWGSVKRFVTVLRHFAAGGDYGWDGEDVEFLGEAEDAALARKQRLQAASVAQLSKLLVAKCVPPGEEPVALAQLLLFFFNPSNTANREKALAGDEEEGASDDDPVAVAMQVLAVFFPMYAFSHSTQQKSVLEGCKIALRCLINDSYSTVPGVAMPAPPPKKQKGGGFLGNTSFLSYIAYLTDAAELAPMQRQLRERGLVAQNSDEDNEDDTANVQGTKATNRVLAPKKRTATQTATLQTLASLSCHEQLGYYALLEASWCFNATSSGTELFRKFAKLFTFLKPYSRFNLDIVYKNMVLARKLAKSVTDRQSLQCLQKYAEGLEKFVKEADDEGSGGAKKKAVQIPEEVSAKVDEELEAHLHESATPAGPADLLDDDPVSTAASPTPKKKKEGSGIAGQPRKKEEALRAMFDFDDVGDVGPVTPSKKASKPAAPTSTTPSSRRSPLVNGRVSYASSTTASSPVSYPMGKGSEASSTTAVFTASPEPSSVGFPRSAGPTAAQHIPSTTLVKDSPASQPSSYVIDLGSSRGDRPSAGSLEEDTDESCEVIDFGGMSED